MDALMLLLLLVLTGFLLALIALCARLDDQSEPKP
jgi:hypothetical protein